MKFDLCNLFERCLSIKYTHIENDGSFASQRIDKTRYIYFQHSNGKTDWMNNFDFPSKVYHDNDIPWRCHRGFLKVWKSLEFYIDNIIASSDIESTVVVGYSHGAAIAALCYEFIWYTYPHLRASLYGFAFGSPRIFYSRRNYEILNQRFEKFINIVNADDIVTKLPPKIMGYIHMGKILYIGEDKMFFSIKAHKPESYRRSLKYFKCIIDI